MPQNKSSAILSLVLVFLSGVLVGGVSYRLYAVNTVSTATGGRPQGPPHQDPEEVRKHLVHEMQERVKLDDAQTAKLNEIYDRTRQEFQLLKKKGDAEGHQIWEGQRAAVRAILRPDQVSLYDQYVKEQDEMRKKRRAEGKK